MAVRRTFVPAALLVMRPLIARDQSATPSSLNRHKMRAYARPYSWRQTCGSKAHAAYRSAPAGGNAVACLDSAMGKRSKFREARRQQAARAVCAVLAAHSKRKNGPAVVAHCGEFKPQYRAKIEAYRAFVLRAPEDWRCRLKSRSQDRRFIDLVRFAFAKYPVPAHLENVWLEDVDDDFVDDVRARARRAGEPRRGQARPDLLRWYIVASQGGSLHKKATHPYMSKLETHYFLGAPEHLTSGQAAFWYAIARAHADDDATARKVAQTKLCDFSVASSFWKDAARFFARNPASVREMNDLIDFFAASIEENENFSLKGRTLPGRCGGAWRSGIARCASSRPSAVEAGRAARSPTPTTQRAARPRRRSGASARSRPATTCSRRASACTTASPATNTFASRATSRYGR